MPKKRQPDTSKVNDIAPVVAQAQGPDPSIWDMDTAIDTWTTLVNQSFPNLLNTINYLKGVIDTL